MGSSQVSIQLLQFSIHVGHQGRVCHVFKLRDFCLLVQNLIKIRKKSNVIFEVFVIHVSKF